LIFSVVVIYAADHEEISEIITDDYNDLHDRSNDYLNKGDNNSDDYNFLRNLFSLTELDRDSTDADLNLNFELKGLYKRFAEDTVPVAEKLKIGNSANKNSIFFNFLSGKFLRAADISIILEGNASAVNLNDLAISDDSEREQEPYRDFNEKIPLLLPSFEQKDAANTNS
jgi:hypothetical protein